MPGHNIASHEFEINNLVQIAPKNEFLLKKEDRVIKNK